MNNDQHQVREDLDTREDRRLLDNGDQSPLDNRPNLSTVPLISSGPGSPPPRTLTFKNGLAVVVGIQIGSGIFSAPATVISVVESRTLAVIAWLLAGLLAWTGAISFIELGSLVPVNGGMLEYLIFLYNEELGFIFAWSWILISRPSALAMVSLIFSEYLHKAFTSGDDAADQNPKIIAVVGIVLVTVVNCLGSSVGNGVAKAFMALKIVGLLSIALSGLVYWTFWPGASNPGPRMEVTKELTSNMNETSHLDGLWANLDAFTNAVLAAVFAYGGWESARASYCHQTNRNILTQAEDQLCCRGNPRCSNRSSQNSSYFNDNGYHIIHNFQPCLIYYCPLVRYG